MSVERVGVVGAGTMGSGIAQLACLGGFETALHDPLPEALATGVDGLNAGLAKGAGRGLWAADAAAAAAARLRAETSLDGLAGCDLVIEAAPEDLDLKRELFRTLETLCGDEAILATNTSSLSVTAIAAALEHPGRCCGMHFFNPPPLMKLVEIVAGDETEAATLGAAGDVAVAMGREPIRAADGIGFLANRLVRPFTLEGLRLLADGVAEFDEIDRICRRAGFRMGPFELIDLVGVDVNLAVAKSFWEQSFHEPRWQPSPLQARLVAAGRLGRKSGHGFYDYREGSHRRDNRESAEPLDLDAALSDPWDDSPEGAVLGRILAQIVNEAHFATAAGVGTRTDADKAMRLGFNWPRGPFEWGEAIGMRRAVAILDDLWEERREERYRVAPSLRQAAVA